MLSEVPGKNKDIIYVDKHKVVQVVSKHVINQVLEHHRGVREPKRHDQVLEVS